MLSIQDVRTASDRIQPFIVRTPLERSAALSDLCGADIWLKLECFQLTGSFKMRGALNALLMSAARQVVTASAGNHGLGVAWAAQRLGVEATVVAPETASQAKVDALRRSGARLIQTGQTYDDAEAAGIALAREHDLPFISPYNDAAVIAGGGTVALEIFEDLPRAQTLVVPAGGGGLISGVGIASHGIDQGVGVYGVQSEASPALHAALQHGGYVHVNMLPSLADGLAGNVEPASMTLDLIKAHVREVALVTEDEIAAAMRWLLVNERVVVEGSAAVGVAALLQRKLAPTNPTVLVLTGRNVAAAVLQAAFSTPLTPRVGAS
jgi:threonine dehydratase